VDLVSTPVNYMTGEIAAPYAGKLLTTEIIDGIVHHWVWALPDIHRSRARRALNYLSFSATATLRAATLPRPDVIIASSPPLSVATVGTLLSRRFRRPWVLEIRDPWPEAAVAAGWLAEGSRVHRTLSRLSRRYEATATAVLLPTPGLVDAVTEHGARHVAVVTGAVSERAQDAEVRSRVRAQVGADAATCVFVYLGAHGLANGLDIVLDAAKVLRDGDRTLFVLAGDGSDRHRLERRVRDEEISNVRILGAVPYETANDLLQASDVCLHVLRPDPLFAYALPNKILSYFEARRPFITNVDGLPARLSTESGGAFTASLDEFTNELRRWTQMSPEERQASGEYAFEYGRVQFGFEQNVDRLERLLEDVARSDGRR
jgi:glycosyltransferase involved in cell wall biosynthesis